MKWWVWWKSRCNNRVESNPYRLIQFGALAVVLTVPAVPWLKSTLLPLRFLAQSETQIEPSPRPEQSESERSISRSETEPTEPSPKPKQTPKPAASNTSAKICPAPQPTDSTVDQPIERLVTGTGIAVMGNLEAMLTAQFSVRPFPEIHRAARLSRVPVIMYHDILPKKQVFFDVTPAEFAADLRLIQQKGLTPISLDQLVAHLRSGMPLPEKPILLTFDDGYQGHYDHVYPLLKKYGYPGTFAIYTAKVSKKMGRSSLTWAQIREMAADPLITIAAHSVNHPSDLSKLAERRLQQEVVESKRILETQLGRTIKYFVYPEGKYDERVQQWVRWAGYRAALTMDDAANQFAGASDNLLSIERIGQGNLEAVIDQAYGGALLPSLGNAFQFDTPIQLNQVTVDQVPLMLATGGRPVTIHAPSRYQVGEITANTNAVAAVDGGFFSLKYLNSNVMVGPVFSQSTHQFVPGNVKEIGRLRGRPLVLISADQVKYIPFDPEQHNSLENLKAELPDLTDAFVAAAWLVKDSQPQPAAAFGNLFDFDAARDRAFWGIDQAGRAVVGVSGDYVDSITLGKALSQAGLRDAVMLDSGASASLVYQGKSQMGYEPRPVPHVVALVPSEGLRIRPKCK